ncbi:MAG: PQQ-binding-like beta-propeller repeat protein [Verrucomicrobiales bacterium]
MKALTVLAWLAFFHPFVAMGNDWHQFLGPNRNGSLQVEVEPWPDEGPTNLWSNPVGQGFSGPVVSEGKLILFHRIANEELVECLDARSGSNIWRHSYGTKYRDDFGFDEGPRSTPAIEGGMVFSYGADGMITALDFNTGKKRWTVDARAQFSASKGFFGRACSPLVTGDLVVLNVGGKNGAGIVALEKTTGKLRWKATGEEASYSSPLMAEFEGEQQILVLGRSFLYGVKPSGQLAFEYPFKPGVAASVTAATPLVLSNQVFLTASYDTGALMLQRKDGKKLEKIWGGEEILSSHYATPVLVNGYLFGFDGRQEFGPALTCVAWNDGKVMWREERFGAGSIIALGKNLLIMMESGELIMAAANPEKFEELARHQILGSTVRAYPAYVDGLFYARDKSRLVCVQMVLEQPKQQEATEPPITPEIPVVEAPVVETEPTVELEPGIDQ